MKKIKILIVEDEPLIAKDISSLLKIEGYEIVGVAHNASMALDYLNSRNPDFAILDIYLGTGMNGIELAEIIHQKYQIPYIFLTSFSDEKTLEAAQVNAPYGFLVKPFQDRTLVATVSLALNNYKLQKSKMKVDLSPWKGKLTGQEERLVMEIVKGLSNKQIADQLFISINTVKYHLKNIYSKMEVANKPELLAKVLNKQ